MIDVNEYELYRTLSDLPVKTLCFKPDEKAVIKGVVQILHGMCEYKERYLDFIKFLNINGYICVINDMRGHGENVSFFKELGYFGEDGAKLVIKDTHAVTVYIKNNFPDLPIILFGHSMGSLIARVMLKYYDDDYERVILTGSPSNRPFKCVGSFLADVIGFIRDEKKTSLFLDALVMGPYYMKFRKEKLKNAWICSDTDVVNEFNENMYSNFTFTINGYYTLLGVMSQVYSRKKWRLKNKRIPIYFLSGRYDPCMVNEKSFYKSVNFLKNLGYRHVESKLYDGMRHEILNEKEKKMVYEDIIKWLSDEEDEIDIT